MKSPLITFIVVLCFSCNTQKQAALQNSNYKFKYESFSRGYRLIIDINSEKTHIESTTKQIDTVIATPKQDWKILLEKVNSTDLSTISNLTAPTNHRFSDGAATASLLISKENKNYQSSNFDHGNPPEEIADLINTITALEEAVE